MGSSSRRWLNQSTHSSVAYSTSSIPLPRTAPADELALVEADDRLGQSIVERVSFGPDRVHDAGLTEALGVADREVLPRFKRSSQRYRVDQSVELFGQTKAETTTRIRNTTPHAGEPVKTRSVSATNAPRVTAEANRPE
jgi:hypothetical protein